METFALKMQQKDAPAAMAYQTTLTHYNRAIGLLTSEDSVRKLPTVALLGSCQMFFNIEAFSQNRIGALSHLRAG